MVFNYLNILFFITHHMRHIYHTREAKKLSTNLSHEGSQKIEYKFITRGKSKTLNTNLSHEGSQKIEYKFITRGKPKH